MVAFRTTLPKNVGALEYPDDVDWFDNVTPKQRLDLWTTVTSVLCVGVNNPQNGKRHSGINFVFFEIDKAQWCVLLSQDQRSTNQAISLPNYKKGVLQGRKR